VKADEGLLFDQPEKPGTRADEPPASQSGSRKAGTSGGAGASGAGPRMVLTRARGKLVVREDRRGPDRGEDSVTRQSEARFHHVGVL